MHNDYWLGPSGWRVLVGQHVTQVLPLPGLGCGGTVESCRRQDAWDGAWTAGHLAAVISGELCFSWQLTHLPVSELPWPGAGGSG